jgi:hypothetical protein
MEASSSKDAALVGGEKPDVWSAAEGARRYVVTRTFA